jgi:putrescine transport system permease protein
MAYVAVIIQSRLTSMDNSVEESSLDQGSTPLRVLWDITLPIIAPAMVSGWLLSFTLSLDDLVIASFTSGAGASTLPMVIFSKVKLGVTPEVNALATLIIAVVAIGVAIAGWLMLRQQRQAARENQVQDAGATPNFALPYATEQPPRDPTQHAKKPSSPQPVR